MERVQFHSDRSSDRKIATDWGGRGVCGRGCGWGGGGENSAVNIRMMSPTLPRQLRVPFDCEGKDRIFWGEKRGLLGGGGGGGRERVRQPESERGSEGGRGRERESERTNERTNERFIELGRQRDTDRERERERQTDRQRGRQTDRQKQRQRETETYRDRERGAWHSERNSPQGQSARQTDPSVQRLYSAQIPNRQAGTETQRDRERETETYRDIEKERSLAR